MQLLVSSLLLIAILLPGNSEISFEEKILLNENFSSQKNEAALSDLTFQTLNDIEFARIDSQSLRLDLYLPQGVKQSVPVLIWLHGGAFVGGDKANAHKYAPMFAQKGIAVASVNYRLLPASYPSAVNDVKGAIRFLRANAAKYHLDPNHIAVLGTSAGGSLACQVGVTCGEKDLEGAVGGNQSYSSCVQAVVDCFGSFSYDNMMKIGFSKSRESHLEQLCGCDINSEEGKAFIRKMAPEFHLDKNDPPFLILHGDQDQTVPVQNSIDFDKKLRAAGIPSTLIIAKGYNHDARMVTDYFDSIMQFLNQYLK